MELTRITATGTVRSTGGIVKQVIVTPAAAIVTLVLRDGGAGGTTKLEAQAAANGGSTQINMSDNGIVFSTDVHATITGAGALVYIGF